MSGKAKKKSKFPLLDHIDKLVAELHEKVPAALDRFEADDVHQARVATRRLAAALDLMDPVLSKKHRRPVADGLKRLRRRLGPLRDADVMIGRLGGIEQEGKHAAAAGWLRRRLAADRDVLRRHARRKASPAKLLGRLGRWPDVRAEIAEAHEAVDCLLAESLHLQVDAFAEQADWLVRELDGAEDAADQGVARDDGMAGGAEDVTAQVAVAIGGEAGEDGGTAVAARPRPRPDPHDLRIAGKALRYTLEMADAEGHSPGAGVMKQFKRMQDLLGSWHDDVVLADRTLTEWVAAGLAHHDPAAAERALDLARHAVRRSANDLAAFAKLWRQHGEKLAAKVRAAFPLTLNLSALTLSQQTTAGPPELRDDRKDREPGGSAAGSEGVGGPGAPGVTTVGGASVGRTPGDVSPVGESAARAALTGT